MSFLVAGCGLLLALLAEIVLGDISAARRQEARRNTLAFDIDENRI
jgi:hypothetical protein